nr:unnamed protein product [Callosobruchus analis]
MNWQSYDGKRQLKQLKKQLSSGECSRPFQEDGSSWREPERLNAFQVNQSATVEMQIIQPILNLPFFVDEPQLCVASTFVRYLNVTKGLKNWCDWLLIASKISHRKASTSNITRWIKGMLESSGLEMLYLSRKVQGMLPGPKSWG